MDYMAKMRSPNSLLTKLENMAVGDEVLSEKSNGYVSDNIATIKTRFPDRKYRQTSVFTHLEPFDENLKLKDFKKVIFITRIA